VMTLETAAKAKHRCQVYNLGADEFCTVRDSISWICGHLRVDPKLEFTGGERGWVGDNPFIYLETKKIRNTGWQNELTIQAAVLRTLDWLSANTWVFEKRT
jgi:UDP-glucose 4-epimerase